MLSRRQFTRVLAASLAGAACSIDLPLAPVLAAPPDLSDLRFTVMRGRSKIGTHLVEFQGGPEALVTRTTIDLAVKVFFVTAYRTTVRSAGPPAGSSPCAAARTRTASGTPSRRPRRRRTGHRSWPSGSRS